MQKLYETALAIDKHFDSTTASSDQFSVLIQQILILAQSSSTELQKIAEVAARFNRQKNQQWTHRQFLDLIVPLERFLNKQVTDADLLHDRPDKTIAPLTSKNSIILIADHIRSAFNIGAFFRTADAFAVEKIILTGYSPTPEHPAVAKTALGAQHFTLWQHIESTELAIHEVKKAGYQVCALETTNNAKNIYNFTLPQKLALLVGNERFGISPQALVLADHIIEIPMLGQKNSLNVATTFALIAYEWHRSISNMQSL